jgi:hypothetical protein
MRCHLQFSLKICKSKSDGTWKSLTESSPDGPLQNPSEQFSVSFQQLLNLSGTLLLLCQELFFIFFVRISSSSFLSGTLLLLLCHELFFFFFVRNYSSSSLSGTLLLLLCQELREPTLQRMYGIKLVYFFSMKNRESTKLIVARKMRQVELAAAQHFLKSPFFVNSSLTTGTGQIK